MAPWLRLSCAATIFAACPVAHAQVVPDGGTPTTATTAASGKVTVGIAAVVQDGISHNTYSRFSVGAPGLAKHARRARIGARDQRPRPRARE